VPPVTPVVAEADAATIARYLAAGTPLVSSPGLVFDPLDSTRSLSLRVLSDGVFVWPAFAAYYCEQYGILPATVVCQQALRTDGACASVEAGLQTSLVNELMSGYRAPVDLDALRDELAR
jgi:hypothetical protein